MMKLPNGVLSNVVKKQFFFVAIWQLICFVMLLILVWANEMLDLPAQFYGTESSGADYFAASTLSLFVVVTAVITIGQTYLTQQRIITGMIVICSRCHRIKLSDASWQQLESYVTDRSEATFSHALCPECFTRDASDINAQDTAHARKS
jgi:hypothetical protein